MKNLIRIFSLLLLAGFVFACEGPMGPAGLDGTDGVDGTNGTNGVDGTAKCSVCHNNSATIVSAQLQYEHSTHAMNDNAAYGNRPAPANDCARCHVSQGFLDFMPDGAFNTAFNATMQYQNPQQPNCYTCHSIHKNFDATDWNLTFAAAKPLLNGGATYDKGKSNLCANCHQARAVSPMPVVGGGDITLTSDRWGTHHGPTANVLSGKGLYDITGTTPIPTSNTHFTGAANGCVTCHMANAYGDLGGGHTMSMEYDVHGTETLNTEGCLTCHSAAEAKTYTTTLQTSIAAKLATLQGLLETKGIYDPANGRNKKATFTADVAGAYLMWQTLSEDRSLGVHNPKYVKAVLDNAIEKMSAK